MLPRGYVQFPSFPTYRVSRRQLLTAISFPGMPASLGLQLPNPTLATSSLNIEHNEHAFFKQVFYVAGWGKITTKAPLKGTNSTKSKKRICAIHLLIKKRSFKTIIFHINFFTHIYKVDS